MTMAMAMAMTMTMRLMIYPSETGTTEWSSADWTVRSDLSF
jgi:hypothetical protein